MWGNTGKWRTGNGKWPGDQRPSNLRDGSSNAANEGPASAFRVADLQLSTFFIMSQTRQDKANEKELQNGQRETPEWTGAWEAGRRVRNYVDCLL